jgi:hypothetical protein
MKRFTRSGVGEGGLGGGCRSGGGAPPSLDHDKTAPLYESYCFNSGL